MASFLINHVLVPVLESRIARTVLRVIDVDHQASQLLVIALESPLKKPWILGFEEVLFEIEQGVLRLDQDVPAAYMLKSEDKLTEKEKSSRENTWGLIRELVDGKSAGDLFADGEFGRRVADQAATRNVSRGIIYKLLYRYWAHGQSKMLSYGSPIAGALLEKGKSIKKVRNLDDLLSIVGLLNLTEQYGSPNLI